MELAQKSVAMEVHCGCGYTKIGFLDYLVCEVVLHVGIDTGPI